MTTINRALSGLRRALPLLAALTLTGSLPAEAPARAQQPAPEITGSTISVSSGAATLEIEMADGATHRIEFRDGRVTFDGDVLGEYRPDGELARSWRELLATAMRESPTYEMGTERLRSWEPEAEGASASTAEALTERLDRVLEPPEPPRTDDTVSMEGPGGEGVSLAPGRLSFDRLTTQLRRLQGALERLDADARAAGEDLSLVVHDDHEIPAGRTVDGNLALLGGQLRLGGTVRGDVLVLDGTLDLEPTSVVEGDVLQVGGDVRRRGGRVGGELLSVQPVSPRAAPEAPDVEAPDVEAPAVEDLEERIEERVRERMRDVRDRHRPGFFGRVTRNVGHAVGGVFGWIGVFLMLGLAGILAVYFLRPQLEVVADTVRHSFGRSFGVGLAGGFLFFPVLLILVVAVITWLVVPFYVVAAAVACLGGLLAVAHAAGEMLARRRFQYEWMERLRRSNSYYYVLSGLAVLLLPFAISEVLHLFGSWLGPLRAFVHFVASAVLSVAAVAGFGAVLLSRGGQRAEYARSAGRPGTAEPEGGA